MILGSTGCTKKKTSGDYPIQPVPFTSVKLTDDFWAPRIRKNATVTIPIAFSYCESTGRVRNFEIAAGLDTGKFQTIFPFDDSDVFKIIEGASFSLQTYPDPRMDAYLDTLIYKIGQAQEDDGYLYTNRTIAEMHRARDFMNGQALKGGNLILFSATSSITLAIFMKLLSHTTRRQGKRACLILH